MTMKSIPRRVGAEGGEADSSSALLWSDVCLASSHFHRAQSLLRDKNATASAADAASENNGIEERKSVSGNTDEMVANAERALQLYQSCLRRVKKNMAKRRRRIFDMMNDIKNNSNKGGPTNGSSTDNEGRYTINLELRMAQTLRFLAFVRASSSRGNNNNTDDASSSNLEGAIKYHDMAVSLLVGVYEDDEEGENDGIESREPEEDQQEIVLEGGEIPMDALPIEEEDEDGVIEEEGSRVMLAIRIPNNAKLSQHTASPASSSPTATPTHAMFVQPTENERVRSIARSLNALADLHAQMGNDRAAMDSYREALEILRAATEEDEEDEIEGSGCGDEENCDEEDVMTDERGSDGGDHRRHAVDAPGEVSSPGATSGITAWRSGSSASTTSPRSIDPPDDELAIDAAAPGNLVDDNVVVSPLQSDLATTLTNVGNFHLRRDELDAALNAYSTVWALYNDDGEGGGITGGNCMMSVPSSEPVVTTPTNDNKDNKAYHPLAISSLHNMGLVHERQSNLDEALNCFRYVHTVRSMQLGREHIDTVGCLINIGNCYQRMGRYDEGCKAYEEVVGVYRKLIMKLQVVAEDGHPLDDTVRLHRSLAGALRNLGTCHLKRRHVSEAIDCLNDAVDVEDKIVTNLSMDDYGSGRLGGQHAEATRQAMESKAQLLGMLGCLYLEYKLDKLKSYDKSRDAFQDAIKLYEGELGFESNHPSVVWARHNLGMVKQLSRVPPPPPPPPPPEINDNVNSPRAMSSTVGSSPGPYDNDIVDLDEIDSVELDEALATDDENDDDDDIFSGVDVNSTEELDEFLSREEGAPKQPAASKKIYTAVVATGAVAEGRDSFEEEVDFDTVVADETHGHQPNDGDDHDDDVDERVSQLQLQTESSGNDDVSALEAAEAHIALAEHYWERKDSASATSHYTEAHSIYQQRLGDTPSEEVAMILKRLGDLNSEDGSFDAAKELYVEALEMESAVFGQYRPQTLNAAGAICLQNEDFRSSMDFHRRALQIQRKSQHQGGGGEDKYEMYETLVRIGNVYYSERNNLSNIRSLNSSGAGVDYREFIESGFLGWIANAHDMRGEYTKAVQFYEESLQIYMSRKGREARRETALTLNRLGSLTRELGRYDEAIDYHQKALNIQKTGSGVAKANTAETCVLMGMVKCSMGQFRSALNLYEDSLIVLNNSLGEDHSSSWKTMSQIGSVHFELSNYGQALKILLEAEGRQLASVGEENRDTLETQAQLGRVLSATCRFEEALAKLTNVLERQRALFGSKHPTIADTLSYIGECFLDQGMAAEARGQFVDCYNMRKQFFSVDSLPLAEAMVNIIRARPGQPERSLAIYGNAMEVYKEYLSEDHVQIGRLCVYEGDSYAELLDFSMAVARYERARKIFHRVYEGEHAVDSALVAVNSGKVLLRKCDYDSAKSSFASALEIYEQILPDGHPTIKSTLNLLDRVEQEEALCV